MPNVTRAHNHSTGQVELRWAGTGKAHSFTPDDVAAGEQAYIAAVAEGLAAGDTIDGEPERAVARALQKNRLGVDVRKDAQDSICIVWQLPEDLARSLAVPGGLAPEDMHVTLLYLGDPDADGSGPWDLQKIVAVTCLFAGRWGQLEGTVSGTGRFVAEGDNDCLIYLLDVPELASMRQCLREELYCYDVIPYNSPAFGDQHGFVPHITAAYVPKTSAGLAPLSEPIEIHVDNLSVWAGSEHVSFAIEPWGSSGEEASMAPYLAARDAAVSAGALASFVKAERTPTGRNLQVIKDAVSALQIVIDASADSPTRKPEADAETRKALLAKIDSETPARTDLVYTIQKSDDEQRFTLGPLYAPDRKDAHGEYTDLDTLQPAIWEYVRHSADEGRRLNLQHGDLGEDVTVAEWVEIMSVPFEHTVKMAVPGEDPRDVTLAPGTVWMGVIWDDDAWPLVKSGKLGGYSLGGKAIRVDSGIPVEEMKEMGDQLEPRKAKAEADGVCPVCGQDPCVCGE